MSKLQQCPGPEEMARIVRRPLPDDEAETLATHLEGCPRCACAVERLLGEDALIAPMKQRGPEGSTPSPDVQALIVRLKGLVRPQMTAQGLAFACASCGKRLRVRAELAGKKVKCPGCGKPAQVPQVAPADEQTLPPREAGTEAQTLAPSGQETQTAAPLQEQTMPPSTEQTGAGSPLASGEGQPWDFLAPPHQPGEMGRLGPYRVLKVLGAGGMGVVFKAEDPQLKRLVALKAMLPALAASPSAKARFLREAQAAAAIKHDHIVSIYQVGEDRGAPYLAMEFLEGEPLDARLEREGRLPIPEVIRIGREMAEGLEAAFERGLIHRDIKPANVWIEKRKDRVKILDFGLARAADDQANLTQQGAIVGTPAYMAPEQARGEAVDHRTDLFSLGCVLYRLATGLAPFKGTDTISTLMAVAMEQPKPPHEPNPEVPRPLSDLIMLLLEKEPEKRPRTAKEIVEALAEMTAQPATASKSADEKDSPEVLTARAPGKTGKPKWPWAVAAGALLAIGLGYLAVTILRVETPHGTLVVESDDDNLEFVVKQGGLKVGDRSSGREYTLSLGKGKDGEIEVMDQAGLRLLTKSFELKKGDRTRVRITREEVAAARKGGGGPAVAGKAALPAALSPFDRLRREDIPAEELAAAGGGDPSRAPKELVAVLGRSRLKCGWWIGSVHFSADGKLLTAIRMFYPQVRRFDAETGRTVASFSPPFRYTFNGCSRDGRWVASQREHSAKGLIVTDLNEGKEHMILAEHVVGRVAFSEDGKQLAAAFTDGSIRVCDAATGKEHRTLKGYNFEIYYLAFSRDGKRLASTAFKDRNKPGEVRVWDLDSSKESLVLKGTSLPVGRLTFSPDGSRLVGNEGPSGVCYVWDARSGEKISSSRAASNGDMDPAFSPDGERLFLAASFGHQINVISVMTGKLERAIPAPYGTANVAVSPDGKRLAAGGNDGTVWVWDAATGKPLLTPGESFSSVAISPDGLHLALGVEKEVKLWDVAAGKNVHTLGHPDAKVTALAFRPGGKQLTGIGNQGSVRVWDLDTRRASLGMRVGNGWQGLVAYSGDGSRLAVSGRGDRTVRVSDAQTGDPVCQFQCPEGGVGGLALSPDGKWLAHTLGSPVEKTPLTLRDATTGQEVHTFRWFGGAVGEKVFFSPDGKRLFGSFIQDDTHKDRGFAAWDLKTKLEVWRFYQRRLGIRALSPDGGTILAASDSGELCLVDARGAEELQRWQLPPAVVAAAFAPDGRHLVTRNANGTVYVLRLAPPPREKGKP